VERECLDARNYSTKSGTVVQQWPCKGTANQLWVFGFGPLTSAPTAFENDREVLDVRNSGTRNGTPVQLWQYKGSVNGPNPNQIWTCDSDANGCP
jgi:hypothetical protein